MNFITRYDNKIKYFFFQLIQIYNFERHSLLTFDWQWSPNIFFHFSLLRVSEEMSSKQSAIFFQTLNISIPNILYFFYFHLYNSFNYSYFWYYYAFLETFESGIEIYASKLMKMLYIYTCMSCTLKNQDQNFNVTFSVTLSTMPYEKNIFLVIHLRSDHSCSHPPLLVHTIIHIHFWNVNILYPWSFWNKYYIPT